MKFFVGRVIENRPLQSNYWLMQIEHQANIKLAKPGQFALIQPSINEKRPLFKIPLSILEYNETDIFFLYRVIGKKSEELKERRTNDEIKVLAPLGQGYNLNNSSKVAIIVGGGSGIASIFSVAKKLEKRKQLAIFIGARDNSDIVLQQEFENLNGQCYFATDDGSYGTNGLVTDVLEEFLIKNRQKQLTIYASGPKAMLMKLITICKRDKIPGQLSFEAYMGCGMGVCKGCAVPEFNNRLCCRDGPVFEV